MWLIVVMHDFLKKVALVKKHIIDCEKNKN